MTASIPVIDLGLDRPEPPSGAERVELVRQLSGACTGSGFFVVVGHGVPRDVVGAAYAAARSLFSQPDDVKLALLGDPRDPLQRGFCGYDTLQLYCMSRLGEAGATGGSSVPELSMPNRWPQLPGFRSAVEGLYDACADLAMTLMRLLAVALELPEDWFEPYFDDHMSPLGINYYLPQSTPLPEGSFRSDPHTDHGTLTILYQDDAPGGLQVLDQDGVWRDVVHRPYSFVVNLGRLMTRWTNGTWNSALHRVVHPPAAQRHQDRISIAFFHQPNADAVIECIPTCLGPAERPRQPPVTSGDYCIAQARRALVKRLQRSR